MKRWGLRVIWCLIDASRTHNLGTGKNHPCTYSSSSFPLHCHHHFIMNIVIIISTTIRTCNLGTGKNHPCTYSSSWFKMILKRSGSNHRARRATNSLHWQWQLVSTVQEGILFDECYFQGFARLVSESETSRLVYDFPPTSCSESPMWASLEQ